MTLEAYHYDTFVGHINIFNVAAVLLEYGANLLKAILYFADYFFFVFHRMSCIRLLFVAFKFADFCNSVAGQCHKCFALGGTVGKADRLAAVAAFCDRLY